ncbi:MAG: DUF2723 domain-containing protein [Deltaproteobacteria bacterium]|nr:DUF2723 domain-containing protein [Deltaproteobacteria bacterium]
MKNNLKFKNYLNFFQQYQFYLAAALSWLIPFFIYLYSLPPGVTWGDSPELANAVITWGVPHPSGYPLFVILGKLFSWLTFSSPVTGLNLMSAVFEAGAIFWLFLIVHYLTRKNWITLLALLFFCFSRIWWQHGRIIEVYALNNFILGGIFYFAIRWISQEKYKDLYLFALFIGLGFSNHLTTSLFFPSAISLLFLTDYKKILKIRVLGYIFLIIFSLQLLYLYLPLSANYSQAIAWNQPDNLSSFFKHVTGSEYSVFRDFSSLSSGINNFFLCFIIDFGVVGVGLALLGFLELFTSKFKVTIFISLFFASSVLYVSIYSVQDIGSYYIFPFYAAAIFSGIGANWLYQSRLGKTKRQKFTAFLVIAILAGAGIQKINKNYNLKYQFNLAHYFGKQAWKELPANSIVISDTDGASFTLWYQAFSMNPEDKSKVVVTKGMFVDKNKKWYRNFLRKKYNSVKWPSEEMHKQLHGPQLLQKLINQNYEKYNIYGVFYFRPSIANYYFVNKGWLSRLVRRKDLKGKIKSNNSIKWTYLTEIKYFHKQPWFINSKRNFSSGENLGCVVEWINKHPMVKARWEIINSRGNLVKSKMENATRYKSLSFFQFKIKNKHQIPGNWQCNLYIGKSLSSSLQFQISTN